MKKFWNVLFVASFLISVSWSSLSHSADYKPAGKNAFSSGAIHGRVRINLSPASQAHVIVTDTKINRLLGESLTKSGKGPDSGSYQVTNLPTNQDLLIFVFHDNVPNMLGREKISLKRNEFKEVNINVDVRWSDPGMEDNFFARMTTLLSQSSNAKSANSIISKLKSLKSPIVKEDWRTYDIYANGGDGSRSFTENIGGNKFIFKFVDGTMSDWIHIDFSVNINGVDYLTDICESSGNESICYDTKNGGEVKVNPKYTNRFYLTDRHISQIIGKTYDYSINQITKDKHPFMLKVKIAPIKSQLGRGLRFSIYAAPANTGVKSASHSGAGEKEYRSYLKKGFTKVVEYSCDTNNDGTMDKLALISNQKELLLVVVQPSKFHIVDKFEDDGNTGLGEPKNNRCMNDASAHYSKKEILRMPKTVFSVGMIVGNSGRHVEQLYNWDGKKYTHYSP